MNYFEKFYYEKLLPDLLYQLPLNKEKYSGIYGTGFHSEFLLKQYKRNVSRIKAKLIFIDSTKKSLTEKYNGYDIYNVCDIGKLGLDAIILSSFLYEEQMLDMIQKLYGDKFLVYKFCGKKQEYILNIKKHTQIISERKTIKVNFVDLWSDFKPFNVLFMEILVPKYKFILSDNPDILFCSHFSDEHKKYKNCKKIFVVSEPLDFDFGLYDYAIGYPYLNDKRFFHYNLYLTPENVKRIQDRIHFSTNILNRKKFCNFIYSNESWGDGAKIRKEFCLKLNEYKHIDCPGKVLNNMEDAISARYSTDWSDEKRRFIKNYKFTIAFENHMIDGYTTEKLWDPLSVGSIPIYWGNPLIGREIHSEAFINCNDFDNDFDAVIKRVKEIDNDDEYFTYMLSKTPFKKSYNCYFSY